MADKTFGVKVSEEMYDKAKLVIESSGISSKDWFEKAVALYEMNSIKQGSSDYTQDLTELEHHTTRMYELIVNMIQRSVYLKDHAVKDISDKLDSKEAIISEYQHQILHFKEEITLKSNTVIALQEKEKEFREKLHANETTLENNQALISEYKEKNDTLSGLVAKYQGYAEENEALKKAFEAEKASLVQQLNEQLTTAAEQIRQLEKAQQEAIERVHELEKTLENEQINYNREIEILKERKDLEREKALVEIEREYQTKLQAQNDKYNDKIAEMHAENERIRGSYEERLDTLMKGNQGEK